jgi:hypothetical protein
MIVSKHLLFLSLLIFSYPFLLRHFSYYSYSRSFPQSHSPGFSELDAAILFEVLLCLKVVMNAAVGMDAFVTTENSFETLTRCLLFHNKVILLEVLEILSVSCYYSEETCCLVIHGVCLLAQINRQPTPYYSFVHALQTQDIEVKASVVLLINSMIAGLDNPLDHSQLMNDLRLDNLIEKGKSKNLHRQIVTNAFKYIATDSDLTLLAEILW